MLYLRGSETLLKYTVTLNRSISPSALNYGLILSFHFSGKKTYDTAKQTPITIETEPHSCIEVERHSTLVMVNIAAWMMASGNTAAILMMILKSS